MAQDLGRVLETIRATRCGMQAQAFLQAQRRARGDRDDDDDDDDGDDDDGGNDGGEGGDAAAAGKAGADGTTKTASTQDRLKTVVSHTFALFLHCAELAHTTCLVCAHAASHRTCSPCA